MTSDSSNAAVCYYLLGEKGKATEFARKNVKAVMDLFYGNWQTQVRTDLGTYDPNWWRIHNSWVSPFCEGLCWGTVLGDWTRS